MRRAYRSCGIVLAIALVVLLGFGWVVLQHVQTKLIFTPDGRPFGPEPQWAFEDVRLPVLGEVTHGWFVPLDGARGTALISHGNGGNISYWRNVIAQFRSLDLNVLAYDYGGWGCSTGAPSEKRCNADIRAMWEHLTLDRNISPDDIVLFGSSLGTGPTVDLAAQVSPGAVILEGSYTSIPAMAEAIGVPSWLPLNLLVRHRFDNEAKIGKLTSPVLIIHSSDDDFVPYAQGQRLFELAPEPKQFLEIRGRHGKRDVGSSSPWHRGVHDFLTNT